MLRESSYPLAFLKIRASPIGHSGHTGRAIARDLGIMQFAHRPIRPPEQDARVNPSVPRNQLVQLVSVKQNTVALISTKPTSTLVLS